MCCYSYPKGLVIAFKLKSSSDEVPEKNSADQQANDNNDVTKTDDQKPSEVAAEESDQKMSENDDNDKENNGVNEGKEAKGEEKDQEKNGVKEEKETEVEEKGQENNGAGEGKVTEGVEKGQETGKKTAVIFKNDSDVVLREDLKVVFQKFGDVKVNMVFPLLQLLGLSSFGLIFIYDFIAIYYCLELLSFLALLKDTVSFFCFNNLTVV